MNPFEYASNKAFNWVHGSNLVYNTCWEDPRLDRAVLGLGPDDTVCVITSAGCNALDYVLEEPRHIYAVDVNPRQNALLELKLSAIRTFEFDEFFAMFGRGRLDNIEDRYHRALRPQLSESARDYWDRRFYFFRSGNRRDSFYFHGTSGFFASLINRYLDTRKGLRESVEALFEARSVEEQRVLYDNTLRDQFWNGLVRWFLGRDTTLSLLGVPQPQRVQVERHFQGGIAQFIEECIETVFTCLPLGDNYFWRVYLTGHYTEHCCPEYLKKENFARLKGGLADRVSVHTDTVEGFLRRHDDRISRFVLLDHMDWLSVHAQHLLASEWQAIVDRATPEARIIWRSGGLKVDYVDPIEVALRGERCRVGERLTYFNKLTAELHPKDRVHTYGSFYAAQLNSA